MPLPFPVLVTVTDPEGDYHIYRHPQPERDV